MHRVPDGFLWGATASSHQVEGGNFHNDWWTWEQRPGRIAGGAISKVAADHANRFANDFALARTLGHNAHLLSIEWSRVEPHPGEFDTAALNHYQRVLQTLENKGLTPVIALHHVTIPQWLADRGGWEAPESPNVFCRYAEHFLSHVGDRYRWWIPILEPMHTVTRAYLDGIWPPQKRSRRAAWRALRHMALAHGLVYTHLRQAMPEAHVGAHVRVRAFSPADDSSAWDLRTARRETYRRTDAYLKALRTGHWPRTAGLGTTAPADFDFVAMSSEPRGTVRFDWRAMHRQCAREVYTTDGTSSLTDFRAAIRHAAVYERPIIIAGDGIPTDDDGRRCHLLLDHLSVVLDELDAGTPVLGYFHRALLDGFEWTRGYSARYGLIHVDRESMARTPNTSAYLYRDIIESGEIRAGTATRYAPGWRPPSTTADNVGQ